MAEFLAAEELATIHSGSISDSQLQTAMGQQGQMSGVPTQHQNRGQ